MKRSFVIASAITAIVAGVGACNSVLENHGATLFSEDVEGGTVVDFDGSVDSAAARNDAAVVIDGAVADVASDTGPDVATADGGVTGPTCKTGEKLCFGECVDVEDPMFGCSNGTCTACQLNRATAMCSGGVCHVGACNPGYADCNQNPADGCETDLSQPTHCGKCNAVCSGQTSMCVPSGGTFVCANGCPAQAPTACGNQCVNLTTAVNHCGNCATSCPAVANGQVACVAGNCHFTCNVGFHTCGNSCASNLDSSTCGSRCTPCTAPANATATCSVAGQCGWACNTGFHKCGGECVADSSVDQCGPTCKKCPVPGGGGTATCSQGVCAASCPGGTHLCGSQCESNGDVANCGASCSPCPAAPNANATCSAQGVCGITCKQGFADCDGNVANGCEVNVTNDSAHCGTCPVNCNGNACVGGVCQVPPPPQDAGSDG